MWVFTYTLDTHINTVLFVIVFFLDSPVRTDFKNYIQIVLFKYMQKLTLLLEYSLFYLKTLKGQKAVIAELSIKVNKNIYCVFCWFILWKLPMTVKLTSLFLVGAFRKSIRHLYTPVSVAIALSTVRWSTISCSRCSCCSLLIVWKYARSPKPKGEDHHLGGTGIFVDVCLVSYLYEKI